jgi:DNA-binding GntR family transcriptional regulator
MRASDRAYAALRDEIVTWKLAPGTALSEIELADRLGVSRTPLRAALARLALEGLVDTSRGRTGIVPDVSIESVVELFELREALETQAARLAARRGDRVVFAGLADEFTRAAAGSGPDVLDAYYDLITRFDEALDVAVANPAIRSALDGVRTHLARARRLAADNPARLVRAADEHRLICQAIADGDGALAASATAVHLTQSLTSIVASLNAPLRRKGIS